MMTDSPSARACFTTSSLAFTASSAFVLVMSISSAIRLAMSTFFAGWCSQIRDEGGGGKMMQDPELGRQKSWISDSVVAFKNALMVTTGALQRKGSSQGLYSRITLTAE